jgi:hypothetical protein
VAATGEDHSPQAGSAGQDADHDRKDQTTGKSSRLSLVMMVDISGLPLTGVGRPQAEPKR